MAGVVVSTVCRLLWNTGCTLGRIGAYCAVFIGSGNGAILPAFLLRLDCLAVSIPHRMHIQALLATRKGVPVVDAGPNAGLRSC